VSNLSREAILTRLAAERAWQDTTTGEAACERRGKNPADAHASLRKKRASAGDGTGVSPVLETRRGAASQQEGARCADNIEPVRGLQGE